MLSEQLGGNVLFIIYLLFDIIYRKIIRSYSNKLYTNTNDDSVKNITHNYNPYENQNY